MFYNETAILHPRIKIIRSAKVVEYDNLPFLYYFHLLMVINVYQDLEIKKEEFSQEEHIRITLTLFCEVQYLETQFFPFNLNRSFYLKCLINYESNVDNKPFLYFV